MLRRFVSCSKHFRKDSDLLVRIVKRNEGLQPSLRYYRTYDNHESKKGLDQ